VSAWGKAYRNFSLLKSSKGLLVCKSQHWNSLFMWAATGTANNFFNCWRGRCPYFWGRG